MINHCNSVSFCSTFQRFKELYQLYWNTSSNSQEGHARDPAVFVDEKGFINPDLSLPIDFLVTLMPELKVASNNIWLAAGLSCTRYLLSRV